jgi:hypothetical protein
MSTRNYKLAGCLWATPVNSAGVITGDRRKFGNCHPMTIQVTMKSADMLSAMCGNAGQVIESKNEIDTISGAMTLHQWDAAVAGYAVGAKPVALVGEGSTITTQDVTAPEAGVWVDLGAKGLSAVVIKDATDTTTYVQGTDYLLSEQMGLLTIIDGGDITAADVLHLDATEAAETGYRLSVGSELQSLVRLEGALKDTSSGKQINFLAYCANLSADGGITLISSPDTDYEELPLSVSFITPDGYTTPAIIDGMEL